MNQWNAAVIGAGFIGRVHLEAIRRLGHVQIVALVDPELDKAKQLGAELSIGCVAANFQDILRDPAIDAVHVITPNQFAFPRRKGRPRNGKTRNLRKTAGHVGGRCESAGCRRRSGREAELPLPQPALLLGRPADAPPVRNRRTGRNSRGARYVLARLAGGGYRLELARPFLLGRALPLHGGYRFALVRYG